MLPPARKRGGQLGNKNARKHGLYSARAPHPAAALFLKPSRFQPALLQSLPPQQRRLYLLDSLQSNRRLLELFDSLAETAATPRETALWSSLIIRTCSENGRLALQLHKLDTDRRFLPQLAAAMPALVQREFLERAITARPLFVPPTLRNLRTNLASGGPFLTDDQWDLLAPLIHGVYDGRDASRIYRRHKPAPGLRMLLEGILLKLAFAIPWRDLPALFAGHHPEEGTFPLRPASGEAATSRHRPPRAQEGTGPSNPFPVRAAQSLYRRLYLSGRMASIYDALYSHLTTVARVLPQDLARSGTFHLERGRVSLAPGRELTWQNFTALLLLQRALLNHRVLVRQQTAERRAQGLFLRLPALHRVSPPPVGQAPAKPRPVPRATGLSAVTRGLPPTMEDPSLDTDNWPLSTNSLAWLKWQAIVRFEEAIRQWKPPP